MDSSTRSPAPELLRYRCNFNQVDFLGDCAGIVTFEPGQLIAECPSCKTWRLQGDENLGEILTGADRLISHKVRFRASAYSKIEVRCGDPNCHFTATLHGYEHELAAFIQLADTHPCPQPPRDEVVYAMKASDCDADG